jgi:hypothetical protein
MGLLKDIENSTYLLLTEQLAAPLQQVNMPSYGSGIETDKEPKYLEWDSNGTVNAQLDSVQSQANRIEPVFEKFPELVPNSTVVYPNGTTLPLLKEPHRAAAPMIRYYFTAELQSLKAGDAFRLARTCQRRTEMPAPLTILPILETRPAIHLPERASFLLLPPSIP